MPAVIFICTGNRYRSPIAAFRHMLANLTLADQWEVSSAGTWTVTGLPPAPAAIDAAEVLGLDIKNTISTLVNKENLEKYDLVLVMEAGHKEAIINEFPQLSDRVYLLSEIATGTPYDIPDPMKYENNNIGETAVEISDLIHSGFQKTCHLVEYIEASG